MSILSLTQTGKGEGGDGPAVSIVNVFFFFGDTTRLIVTTYHAIVRAFLTQV